MATFTIYHLVGIKVGCTTDLTVRTKENRRTYGDDIVTEILHEITSDTDEQEDWITAGDVEWRFADQLGYKRGTHYLVSRLQRRKMKEVITGVRKTVEHRGKIRAALTGIVFSPERCAMISVRLKGRTVSAEARLRIGDAHRGKTQTAETKAKIAAAHRGKVVSAETRARLSGPSSAVSLGNKRYWDAMTPTERKAEMRRRWKSKLKPK